MNKKMSKFSFSNVNSKASGRGGVKDSRLVGCYVAKDDKSKDHFRWRVSLSGKCVLLSGLSEDDCLTFEYDDGVVLLKNSDATTGRKLTKTNKSERLHLRFTMPVEYVGFFMDRDASEIETSPDGRICFKLV